MDRVFINTDDILKFVEHSLMSDRTDLLYDDTSIKEPDLFPTAAECEASYPNPSGYSTGMEDSNLSGGSMLEALILLYNAYADQNTAGLASKAQTAFCRDLLVLSTRKAIIKTPRAISTQFLFTVCTAISIPSFAPKRTKTESAVPP